MMEWIEQIPETIEGYDKQVEEMGRSMRKSPGWIRYREWGH